VDVGYKSEAPSELREWYDEGQASWCRQPGDEVEVAAGGGGGDTRAVVLSF